MAKENETRPTDADVREHLSGVEHPGRRRDAEALVVLMSEATGEPPTMWGSSMIGFGSYDYRYASGHAGTTMRVGFAARRANLALYGLADAPSSEALLERLGKHRRGAGCVYVTRLEDVNTSVLRALIELGYAYERPSATRDA